MASMRRKLLFAGVAVAALIAATTYSRHSAADALCLAAFRGDTAEVARLLSLGVDPDWRGDAGINPGDCECEDDPAPAPALVFAAFGGHVDVMASLVRAGADVNAQGSSDMTALMWAKDARTVEYLLRQGADPAIQDRFGRTALDIAKDGRNDEIIAVLRRPRPAR
jgi:uncharacterized protein